MSVRPPARITRLAAALGGLILAVLLTAPAHAHPFGLPPVAEIVTAGSNIRTTLTVAMDDTLIMLMHAGASEQNPQGVPPDELATQPEVNAYLTSRYILSVPEGPCEAEVTGGRPTGVGFSFFIDHACPAPVGLELHAYGEFLRDVAPEYRLVLLARAGAGRERQILEPGMTEVTLDLTPRAAPAPGEQEAEDEVSAALRGLERLFAFLDEGRGLGAATIALGIAFALGALHALTPGHGKALVAAYLAGSDAKLRHAFAVGGALTITHTAAVLAFGVFALVAGRALVPSRIEPILMAVAAVLVIGIGLWMLVTRIANLRRGAHAHHHHEHPKAADRALSGRGLVAVGAAGGIVPCPEAFGLLFVALSLGRPAAGLLLLVAFSIGLGAVLVAIAVGLVLSRKAMAPRLERSRGLRYLPVASATIVTGIGVALGVVALGRF